MVGSFKKATAVSTLNRATQRGKGMEVQLAAKGSLTTGWAETIGQRGAGAAWEVPQSLSDYNHCKGKQIATVRAFYA
jgi:hypothetical protein